MTTRQAHGRERVAVLLAGYGARGGDGPQPERIDSLELAWLLHRVVEDYGVELDLDDDQLGRMDTVSGAAEVLREELVGFGDD